mmetsp:Transcript_186/g.414  ORF Transcript_186/g.414 Transcript_186/m.414 type:complete len:82 (+) Transcript_186:169-414(+)
MTMGLCQSSPKDGDFDDILDSSQHHKSRRLDKELSRAKSTQKASSRGVMGVPHRKRTSRTYSDTDVSNDSSINFQKERFGL